MSYRIGIDARIFGAKSGGIGRYTEELARVLPLQDNRDTYVFFMRKKDMRKLVSRSSRVQKVCADIREYTIAEQAVMPNIIGQARIDLLHVPHINVPYLYRGPLVITVHDLIEYKNDRIDSTTLPRTLYRIKHKALRTMLPRTLKRANSLIAVSRYTKRDIEKTFPSVNTPIHIIGHGKFSVARKKKISPAPYPFILYVGSAAPHKNVPRLITVFKECVGKDRIKEHLVLIMPNDTHTDSIKKAVSFFPRYIQERIHFTHALSDKELASYMQHAALFCSPSKEEGYGLPFVEALSCGTKVLGAFVGALPEIAGTNVHYWNPNAVLPMRKKLIEALHSKHIGQNIAFPSWKDVGKAHSLLYTSILRKNI